MSDDYIHTEDNYKFKIAPNPFDGGIDVEFTFEEEWKNYTVFIKGKDVIRLCDEAMSALMKAKILNVSGN